MGYAVYEAIFAALAPVLPHARRGRAVRLRPDDGDRRPPGCGPASVRALHALLRRLGRAQGKDGLSATCPLLNGDNFNIPCEVIEHEFPLRVERYELIQDSAGAGKHRGGLGVRTDYRLLEGPAQVFASLNRCAIPPRGLFGGSPAALNFLLLDRPGRRRRESSEGGRSGRARGWPDLAPDGRGRRLRGAARARPGSGPERRAQRLHLAAAATSATAGSRAGPATRRIQATHDNPQRAGDVRSAHSQCVRHHDEPEPGGAFPGRRRDRGRPHSGRRLRRRCRAISGLPTRHRRARMHRASRATSTRTSTRRST